MSSSDVSAWGSKLSPAEIYNHIDPDEVERLENAYFELDLNAETIYDEDDPDYPAGAPSGGTYALERAQAVALEKINKRRKDPPEVAEASQLPETSLRRKPGRPRKNVNTSRDMLSPDAGSISSSSVSSGPAVAHNPVAATPSGVPAPNDCMEIDHWIDTEVTAQPFQEHSTLSSANNSPRGFIPFASHRSNEGGNALSPSNPNYVAPFDDERDGDFLPNSKSPNKRPVKRSKPSPSNRKPSNSKSSPSGNKNPSLSPFIAPSFLKPEAKKSGPTFQVPITSLFKSLGNTPNVSPAVKPAAKSKKTIMVPPPISSPKAIPSLAMVGASPTEPSRSLFPPPPPIAPVRNKKSKRPWSPTPKARNLQSNGGVTAKNFKTKSGKIFSNSSSSQFSEWDSIDEVSDLPTKDTPPLGICSDSKQVQRKSRTPVSGRRKKSTPPPLATSYYDVDLDELQEPVEPEEYSVESILAYKREAGEIFYLVKWLGYDEPTWEADENLENSRELVEEFQRTRLRGG